MELTLAGKDVAKRPAVMQPSNVISNDNDGFVETLFLSKSYIKLYQSQPFTINILTDQGSYVQKVDISS